MGLMGPTVRVPIGYQYNCESTVPFHFCSTPPHPSMDGKPTAIGDRDQVLVLLGFERLEG